MKNKKKFDEIVDPLLMDKDIKKLSFEVHHGITRMEHTLRVAKYTYKISKNIGFDYESATRAAILHDFFFDYEYGEVKGLKKGTVHPELSLKNAESHFELNDIERNMIVSHMFPLKLTLPRYKEAWLLTIVDKVVAIYEDLGYKFKNYLVNSCSLWLLFIFNMLTLRR